MKKWILLWMLSASCVSCTQAVDANPLIRIRLKSDQNSIAFVGRNIRLNQMQNLKSPYQKIAIGQKQTLQEKSVSIRLDYKNKKNIWFVKMQNQETEKIFVQDRLLIQADNLISSGKKWTNQVLLVARSPRQFDVIGIEKLNDYLIGVVGHEMPRSWPLEALKAQAIVARSYALATQAERKFQHFDVESSVLDQVFHSLSSDSSIELKNVRKAVMDTQKMILKSPQKQILKAYYHADCGGATTTAQNVWGQNIKSPKLTSVKDPWCPLSPKGHWSLELPYQDLQSKLKIYYSLPSTKKLQAFQIAEKETDERVKVLLALWEDGSELRIKGNELRKIIGFSDLKSLKFEMKVDSNQIIFTGSGFGHGVGMCQWGTKKLAELGKSYQKILQHYYPGMNLVSL